MNKNVVYRLKLIFYQLVQIVLCQNVFRKETEFTAFLLTEILYLIPIHVGKKCVGADIGCFHVTSQRGTLWTRGHIDDHTSLLTAELQELWFLPASSLNLA